MRIKAIETRYNGYRFRSRLEARWAVVFDALGLKYEYEPEGYDLGDAGWYLPDFRLYGDVTDMFVEVKPEPHNMTEQERQKVWALDLVSLEFGAHGVVVVGQLDQVEITHYDNGIDFNRQYVKYQLITMPSSRRITVEDFNKAVNKARQARFEFGEVQV